MNPYTTDANTETAAAAAVQAVRETLRQVTFHPGERGALIVPAGYDIHHIDLEHALDYPRRAHGTISVHSAEGFTTAVRQRAASYDLGSEEAPTAGSPVTLYADETTNQLVCLLNDDTPDAAGWRDHRVELVLRRTPEWQHWINSQGLRAQDEFAAAIEKGAREIETPASATMLDLAERFDATVNGRFTQGANLTSGARQLVYEEEIVARGGGASLEVPQVLTLVVRPFVGSVPYRVTAAIKYRLRDGKLTIGYELDRPHDVERAAFTDTCAVVADELHLPLIAGTAPRART
jgi:uncharacterized protein YfdQ (DUF2303 family)